MRATADFAAAVPVELAVLEAALRIVEVVMVRSTSSALAV